MKILIYIPIFIIIIGVFAIIGYVTSKDKSGDKTKKEE